MGHTSNIPPILQVTPISGFKNLSHSQSPHFGTTYALRHTPHIPTQPCASFTIPHNTALSYMILHSHTPVATPRFLYNTALPTHPRITLLASRCDSSTASHLLNSHKAAQSALSPPSQDPPPLVHAFVITIALTTDLCCKSTHCQHLRAWLLYTSCPLPNFALLHTLSMALGVPCHILSRVPGTLVRQRSVFLGLRLRSIARDVEDAIHMSFGEDDPLDSGFATLTV